MKKLTVGLLSIIAGCQPNNNAKMTALIDRKKEIQDSIKICGRISYQFRIANEIDSQALYEIKAYEFKKRLEENEFSIDSLSKMH